MFTRTLRVLVVLNPLLWGAFVIFAQEKSPPPVKEPEEAPVKYEAEEGLPKDKAAEKRRDYAVLEAVLNDLTDPKNPVYKYRIQNHGPRREIVIDDNTCEGDPFLFIDLGRGSRNIDYKDHSSIPTDLQEDFKRRIKNPIRSLADFKPGNPDIIVRDLDKMLDESEGGLALANEFEKRFPTAWGYVLAYLPGYSKDGKSALVILYGGPSPHGEDWFYMLTREGRRWKVQWRHCHLRE